MKRRYFIQFALLCLFFFICNLTCRATSKDVIQRGMTKEQVTAILGKPLDMSFDDYGEQWHYQKLSILNGQTDIFVGFGTGERVRTYYSFTHNPDDDSYCPQSMMPAMTYERFGTPMDESSFSILNKKVSNTSFDSNKSDLIEVASLGCHFSCRQCATLLTHITFTENKLNALRIMAKRIVDPCNADVIYRLFDFQSDRDEAVDIISRN